MAFCLENGIGTAKDTAKADKIREELLKYGIKLLDAKDGTTTYTVDK